MFETEGDYTPGNILDVLKLLGEAFGPFSDYPKQSTFPLPSFVSSKLETFPTELYISKILSEYFQTTAMNILICTSPLEQPGLLAVKFTCSRHSSMSAYAKLSFQSLAKDNTTADVIQ